MYIKTIIRDDDCQFGIYERITWIIDEENRTVKCKIAKYDYTLKGKRLDYVLKGENTCSPSDNWDPVVGMFQSYGKATITSLLHYHLEGKGSACFPGWGRFKRWAVDKEGCEIPRPTKDIVRLKRYLKKEQKAKERMRKTARKSLNEDIALIEALLMGGPTEKLNHVKLSYSDGGSEWFEVEGLDDLNRTIEEQRFKGKMISNVGLKIGEYWEGYGKYNPIDLKTGRSLMDLANQDFAKPLKQTPPSDAVPPEAKNDPTTIKKPSPRLMTVDGPLRIKEPVMELSKEDIEDLLKHVEVHPPFVNVEDLCLQRRREISDALEEVKNDPDAVKGVSDANVEVSSPKDGN